MSAGDAEVHHPLSSRLHSSEERINGGRDERKMRLRSCSISLSVRECVCRIVLQRYETADYVQVHNILLSLMDEKN